MTAGKGGSPKLYTPLFSTKPSRGAALCLAGRRWHRCGGHCCAQGVSCEGRFGGPRSQCHFAMKEYFQHTVYILGIPIVVRSHV